MTSQVSRGKACMSDLCESEDTCYIKSTIPERGPCRSPRRGLKAEASPPPPLQLHPMGRCRHPSVLSFFPY